MTIADRLQRYCLRRKRPFTTTIQALCQRLGASERAVRRVLAQLRQRDRIVYETRPDGLFVEAVAPMRQSFRRCPVCGDIHVRRDGQIDTAICGDCDAWHEHIGERYCRHCQAVKPLAAFSRAENCRQRPARYKCDECVNAMQRLRQQRAYERDKARRGAYKRERYMALRQAGLCVRCQQPAKQMHCPACAQHNAARAQRWREQKNT